MNLPSSNLSPSVIDKVQPNASTKAQSRYVAMMFDIVSRSLVLASRIDTVILDEISALPDGLVIAMSIYGTNLGFALKITPASDGGGKSLARVTDFDELYLKAAPKHQLLHIRFKHLAYAYQVLSFQKSTAATFAANHMVVDGDLGCAVTLVRCLNRLESVILPKALARRAIKVYPKQLSLAQKLNLALRIYGKLIVSLTK